MPGRPWVVIWTGTEALVTLSIDILLVVLRVLGSDPTVMVAVATTRDSAIALVALIGPTWCCRASALWACSGAGLAGPFSVIGPNDERRRSGPSV